MNIPRNFTITNKSLNKSRDKLNIRSKNNQS